MNMDHKRHYCLTNSACRKSKVNKYCVLIAYSLKRASWAYLSRYDSPALFPQNVSLWPYNKSFIEHACSIKMKGFKQ